MKSPLFCKQNCRHRADNSDGLGEDWSNREWLKVVIQDKRPFTTRIYRSRATDSFCFTISMTIRKESGRMVGVMAVDINFENLLSLYKIFPRSILATCPSKHLHPTPLLLFYGQTAIRTNKPARVLKYAKITYKLSRETTRQQTGFFIVVPETELTIEDALSLLKHRPMDDFLHQYVLKRISNMTPERMRQFSDLNETAENPVCRALIAEYQLLTKGREYLEKQYSHDTIRELTRHTPLIYLRSFLKPDQDLHCKWTAFFRPNLHQDKLLTPPDETGLPVAKAIIPGMDLLGDFDDYSRVHPELYSNYLSLFNPDVKTNFPPGT